MSLPQPPFGTGRAVVARLRLCMQRANCPSSIRLPMAKRSGFEAELAEYEWAQDDLQMPTPPEVKSRTEYPFPNMMSLPVQYEQRNERQAANPNGVPLPGLNCSVEISMIPMDATIDNVCHELYTTGKIHSIGFFSTGTTPDTKAVQVVYVDVASQQRVLQRFYTQGLRMGTHHLRVVPGTIQVSSFLPLRLPHQSRVIHISAATNYYLLPYLTNFFRTRVPSLEIVRTPVPSHPKNGQNAWHMEFTRIDGDVNCKYFLETDAFYGPRTTVFHIMDPCDFLGQYQHQ